MQYNNEIKKFGANLKTLREKRNLTLSYANYKGGLNPSTISRIEKGEVEPKLTTLLKIAKSLNVDIKDLFDY